MLNKTKYISIIFSYFKNKDYELSSESSKTTYQLAVLAGFLASITFGIMSFLFLINQQYKLAQYDFIGFIVILTAVFTLKYMPKPIWWINAGATLSYILIFIVVSNTGGEYSNQMQFLYLIPMLTVVCLPWKQVLFWTILSIGQFFYFLGPYSQQQNMQDSLLIWQNFIQFISYCIVIVVSLIFMYFYKHKLNANNLILNETINEISLKNEELNSLIEEIRAQKETLSEYLDKVTSQKVELEKSKIEIENVNSSVLEYVNTLSLKNQEQNNLIEEINTQKDTLSEYLNMLAAKNAELEDSKTELKEINYTMIDYAKVITKLSKLESIRKGIIAASFDKIVEQTSICTKTSFITIITIPTDESELKQKHFFTFHLEKFSISESNIADIDLYYDDLKQGNIINSSNFKENENINSKAFIQSFIYFPIMVDNTLFAILCCENIKQRVWRSREIVFFKSICQLISMTYVINQQKKSEEIIRKQRNEIELANSSLEIKIGYRTAKLLQKNAQLSEFAFLHAHVIRANVCRILGLGQLLEMGVDINSVTSKMVESAKELDSNMKEITLKINEYDNSVQDENE